MKRLPYPGSEVMNPPVPAARGTEARNLAQEPRHGTGAVPRAAQARPADAAPPPAFDEWDAYEEDGPMDLEEQLDQAFARGFLSRAAS